MVDIYLDSDTYNQAQADMFSTGAQRQVADTWAAQASSAAPSLVADAQDRANQAADDQRAQSAATVQSLAAQVPPDRKDGLRSYVGDALRAQGWSDDSVGRLLSSSVFADQSPDQLNAQEDQKQAQSSATGGYYQGALSSQPVPKAGDVNGWRAYLQQYVPDDLKNDPEFLNTLLTGAHGESRLDPNSVQPNGNGRGLFQFDTGPGAMGDGLTDQQLFDPAFQAQHIVPAYAAAYRSAPAGLAPAERASWVAAQAERPFDYANPSSDARRNYARSYAIVSASNAPGGQTAATVGN